MALCRDAARSARKLNRAARRLGQVSTEVKGLSTTMMRLWLRPAADIDDTLFYVDGKPISTAGAPLPPPMA